MNSFTPGACPRIEKNKLMGMDILRAKAKILTKIGQRDDALKLIEEIIDNPNGLDTMKYISTP